MRSLAPPHAPLPEAARPSVRCTARTLHLRYGGSVFIRGRGVTTSCFAYAEGRSGGKTPDGSHRQELFRLRWTSQQGRTLCKWQCSAVLISFSCSIQRACKIAAAVSQQQELLAAAVLPAVSDRTQHWQSELVKQKQPAGPHKTAASIPKS